MNPIYYSTTNESFYGLFFLWFFFSVMYEIRESIAILNNVQAKCQQQIKQERKYVCLAWLVALGMALYYSVPGTTTFLSRMLPVILGVYALFWFIPKLCAYCMAKKARQEKNFHP